ncbi:hypothetical protein SAMN05444266_111138 [Chitinophaga jiangningensis]|uniref:Uncharacterized protein n=1 Tax=Chitinophaga jiangningensis TaxID=1419482 RepID=A0A1M7LUZ3_9BACT|nr:hypothetical protein SAMN05444266_111138 [Chitinophaga jiangningensis]
MAAGKTNKNSEKTANVSRFAIVNQSNRRNHL